MRKRAGLGLLLTACAAGAWYGAVLFAIPRLTLCGTPTEVVLARARLYTHHRDVCEARATFGALAAPATPGTPASGYTILPVAGADGAVTALVAVPTHPWRYHKGLIGRFLWLDWRRKDFPLMVLARDGEYTEQARSPYSSEKPPTSTDLEALRQQAIAGGRRFDCPAPREPLGLSPGAIDPGEFIP